MIQIVNANTVDVPLEAFDGVDTMIVDPPYSEYVHANMVSHGSAGRGTRPRDPGFGPLTSALRLHLIRIAARIPRWSVIFSDHEESNVWRAAATKKLEYVRYVYWPQGVLDCMPLAWVRWSQPQLSGDRPPMGSEAVLHFHPEGRKSWNGPGSLTHYSRRCLRGTDKHPTQKPLDLMLDMVSWFSDPGETVADPCAGVGTTALACKILDRSCVAIEGRAEWCEVAERRVSLAAWAPRDLDRAQEWCVSTVEEAQRVPAPKAKDGSDVKTWERAQRRIADANRVAEWL